MGSTVDPSGWLTSLVRTQSSTNTHPVNRNGPFERTLCLQRHRARGKRPGTDLPPSSTQLRRLEVSPSPVDSSTGDHRTLAAPMPASRRHTRSPHHSPVNTASPMLQSLTTCPLGTGSAYTRPHTSEVQQPQFKRHDTRHAGLVPHPNTAVQHHHQCVATPHDKGASTNHLGGVCRTPVPRRARAAANR